MTKVATAHVPDGMLKWWRERAKVDLAVAAKRSGHGQDDLERWEDGRADPPLSTLRSLTSVYGVPLSAFLLAKPKPEPPRPVDNRTLAGVKTPVTNAPLAKALNRALGLQALADDLHNALDLEPFMVTGGPTVEAEWLAAQERAALGIALDEQYAWENEGEAFREWRLAMERRGIYVLQMDLSDTDVRAFSVRGDPPVIVVKRGDWVRAKIFSLAHELGHVVIGGSGICIPQSSRTTGIEQWCNEFADALLVPKDAFLAHPSVKKIIRGEPATDNRLKNVAGRFKVSPGVIWYRLKQTNAIDARTFHAHWDTWSRWAPPANDGGGGGPPSAERVVRDYGTKLPDLFLRASRAGYLGDLDISQYLSVQPEVIPAIEREIGTRLAS
jgi:Zn-dependent peptidase ImmA (M78 family)